MIDSLQLRIEALETHLAHQDQTVEDLNTVILTQREEVELLTRRVNKMLSRLEELEAATPAPEVTKPPHY